MRRKFANDLSFKNQACNLRTIIAQYLNVCEIWIDSSISFSWFFKCSLLWINWQKIVQFYNINIDDRWKHIYRCRKRNLEKKNTTLSNFVFNATNESLMRSNDFTSSTSCHRSRNAFNLMQFICLSSNSCYY